MAPTAQVPSVDAEAEDQKTWGTLAVKPRKEDIPHHPIDLNAKTVTDIVHKYNSNTKDDRLRFLISHLVKHLHNFSREVSLTEEEWMTSIKFLTEVGQTCSPIRQEFILLSDVLGLSALVNAQNHPVPPGATESTVLGPFFTEDAGEIPLGESIASEGKGEYMYVIGRILNTKGEGIEGAKIETWETDADGLYDTQYSDRTTPDCRGRLVSGKDGHYSYRAVRPVPYPIPNDGPVGKLIARLNRHVFRPAHLHIMIEAPGYENLVTALYIKGDDFLHSDAVFGVKSSLVVDLKQVTDEARAKELGFKHAPFWLCEWDYVLATSEEAAEQKKKTLPEVYK